MIVDEITVPDRFDFLQYALRLLYVAIVVGLSAFVGKLKLSFLHFD